MGQLFGSIYCWLEDFYGLELADYLWGLLAPEQQSNMYIGIGLTMLTVSMVFVVLYYYVIDHPRLACWWGWLLFLTLNAIINFLIGWQWVLKDFFAGKMVKESATDGTLEQLIITESDILVFGVTNMIDAIIAFVLISYTIKWWSSNCPHTPF